MLAMVSDPKNRGSFASQKPKHREGVVDPAGRLEGMVGELAMVADRDSQSGHDVEHHHGPNPGPRGENETQRDGHDVNRDDKREDGPIKALCEG